MKFLPRRTQFFGKAGLPQAACMTIVAAPKEHPSHAEDFVFTISNLTILAVQGPVKTTVAAIGAIARPNCPMARFSRLPGVIRRGFGRTLSG
jgi:hypothetical protein